MAKNKELELMIRISGSLDKSLTSALVGATNQVSGFSRTLGNLGTAGLAAMATMATATVKIVSDCVKEAETLESAMAPVAKYVDGIADASGQISDNLAIETQGTWLDGNTYKENYAAYKDFLMDLSTKVPMTTEELAALGAAMGQSGKDISEQIQYDADGMAAGYLKDAAILTKALDIGPEQAAQYMAKWEPMFDMEHKEVMDLLDLINYLGANTPTEAAKIADVVNRVGSIGEIAGMSVNEVAALSDALLAMGVEESTAATSIRNMMLRLNAGESATAAQVKMWQEMGFTAKGIAKSMQEDAVGTMIAVFQAIEQLPKDRRAAAIKELFGMRTTEAAAKLANNLEPLFKALDMANDPSAYLGSMEREYNVMTNTTEAATIKLDNAWKNLQATFGEAFLPVKGEFAQIATEFLNDLRKNVPELKELAQTLAEVAGKGVKWLAEQIPKVLPYIKQALDYVNNNGPQVAKTLATIAKVLLGMKLAPGFEKALGTVGRVLFGQTSKGGGLSSLLGWGGKMGTVNGLAVAGSALGSGATSTAGLALAGGAGLAGGVLGGAGLISAGVDLYHGIQADKAGNSKDAKTGYMTAGAKAAMVGTGAAIGAAIGSAVPVIGTAIGALVGAGVGGVGALLGGKSVGEWFSDATDEGGVLNVFFTQTLPDAWHSFWDTIGNFFTEGIPTWWNNLKTEVSNFFTVTIPEKWNEFWQNVGIFFSQTIPYALGYAAGKISNFFTQTLPQAWSDFWAAVGNFFTSTLPTWASDIWNNHIVPFFTETLPQAQEDFWNAVGTFFGETLPTWATDVWNNHIVPFFTESLPGFFTELWNGVTTFVTEIIPQWINNIGNAISGFFSSVWNWITSLFSGASESFSQGYGDATGGIPPKYATGGFTHGPSIAGEAGTEAVISFLPSVRSANIAYWLQAGQMLGVDRLLEVGGSHYHDIEGIDPAEAPSGWGRSAGTGPVTFAPQITIQGNADRSVLDAALEEAEARFQSWYEQMQRRQFRTAY